ncbi:hypothetical protein AURANDRAFT_67502 [Aureococcus anophagefferens]|uniref:Uncharacterized protein n=1 Tax=Aureococcus anophagefferens TaxID=44056 RepID=F0YLD5_AURAN|nr:hypothetical protein AURANDRAFT_67502 [Aureococcus anophagefferens]EGB04103.1 hypothetical protein AURANDRAFT_67502 [Aureococcus anophagefferens]|eukprot:XP_009041228.1 hypothetical protein AURANDRAFT_67502 [Aureococcus anophagefferens]
MTVLATHSLYLRDRPKHLLDVVVGSDSGLIYAFVSFCKFLKSVSKMCDLRSAIDLSLINDMKSNELMFVFSTGSRCYEDIINGLRNSGKHFFEHHIKKIMNSMNLNDFKNLSIPMKPVEEYRHILVGPCAIFNGDMVLRGLEEGAYCHGTFHEESLTSVVKDVTETLNKRNKEMIDNCDVFCLTVDAKRSCYRSFAEWGIALALGKVLILTYIDNRGLHPELYLYPKSYDFM